MTFVFVCSDHMHVPVQNTQATYGQKPANGTQCLAVFYMDYHIDIALGEAYGIASNETVGGTD